MTPLSDGTLAAMVEAGVAICHDHGSTPEERAGYRRDVEDILRAALPRLLESGEVVEASTYTTEIGYIRDRAERAERALADFREAREHMLWMAEHLRQYWDNGSIGAQEMERRLARLGSEAGE